MEMALLGNCSVNWLMGVFIMTGEWPVRLWEEELGVRSQSPIEIRSQTWCKFLMVDGSLLANKRTNVNNCQLIQCVLCLSCSNLGRVDPSSWASLRWSTHPPWVWPQHWPFWWPTAPPPRLVKATLVVPIPPGQWVSPLFFLPWRFSAQVTDYKK